ncbi:TetR/AcrR family transcriptional regulator [Pseudomonas cannabina]|uniref:Regulatory protein, TetR n=1 Tax=Pseudomonas cannabina TaxID=86840 RepID=A0A0P9M8U6_PSECA|nr:TetR/AcrR family transcriptional regulator [Pseudomonas cannabina]KAA8707938.1 TetR/AcrR family transcriptional regulator [Pseudomonas cannabina]KPW80359.1 Regulatory protein, TetR [Pseudomonas cannabina]RMN40517.1 Regulatory protein, TetR [Pseudomonas cannabina]SDQ86952.1 transcriptional regulator, TetR family [Pseudomonas cannabina]
MKARTEARHLTIVGVAADVFLELGYDGASMTEVSRRLGGSKATLYGYFRCKEDLFGAVVKMYATSHLYDALASLLQASDDSALHETLVRFGRKMMSVLTHDSKAINVYRLVLSESGRSDIGKLFHDSGPSQCIDVLSDLMSRAMASGDLADACPGLRARQFLSLLTAETGERLFQQEPAPMPMSEVERLVDQAVRMFMSGAGRAL